jgi:hypothetical protein
MASDMYLIVLALTGRRLVTNPRGTLGRLRRKHWETVSLPSYVGCNFPIVLFPCRDRYYVSGECYVDRVLNGELMGQGIRRVSTEREITLCWSHCLINIGRLCWISVKRRPNRVEKLRSRETMVVNTMFVDEAVQSAVILETILWLRTID